MSLDDFSTDVETAYDALSDDVSVSLDRQTRTELALLRTALGTQETDDLLRRAVHLLFQTSVDTGDLDLHLRRHYDITYDEYLSGMTYDEMRGGMEYQQHADDDRRYQF